MDTVLNVENLKVHILAEAYELWGGTPQAKTACGSTLTWFEINPRDTPVEISDRVLPTPPLLSVDCQRCQRHARL